MYIAMHTLVYADDPEAARAFFRDVLEWPHVDTGGGWLIFKSGPSELGVHPTDDGEGWSTPQKLDFSLVVADLEAAMADWGAKGAQFLRPARDDGWGITTDLQIPGGPAVMVYQLSLIHISEPTRPY